VRLRLLVLALLAPLVLAACAGDPPVTPTKDPGPMDTASSPSPRPTAKDSPACELLTSAERKSIAGDNVDVVAPGNSPRGGYQCKWVKSLQAPTPTLIAVVVTSAQQWSKSVPQQVDRAIAAGAAKKKSFLTRLLAAKKKVRHGTDKITDKEACDMFSLMSEIYGRKKGTYEVVSFPAYGTQLSVNARSCRKGRYISFTYTEGKLQPSSPLSFAALRLLHITEARAAKIAGS
jgi:hypothetical protein